MGFDYDKIREKQEENNWWTSYADLWSMLSIVFLVMYVSASLRSGTQGIQGQIEMQIVEKKNEELKEQLRVYSALRDETLAQSGDKEQAVYKQLMDKLSLLKEEAKAEKNDLRRQARENEEKEFALNQYQQVVRNIIDTNVLAKASIQRRDKMISAKSQTIAEKQSQIRSLNQEVKKRENTITQNEEKISEINTRLSGQIALLEAEEQKAKISKAAAAKMVERLKEQSTKKIQALQKESDLARAQMSEELGRTKETYAAQLKDLRNEHENRLAAERRAFEAKLGREKISAAAKAKKLEAFKVLADRRAQELEGELSDLVGKVRSAQNQLAGARAEKNRTLASLEAAQAEKAEISAQNASLSQQKNALGSELKKTRELLAVKKNLISQMQRNFAKQGIKAQVDAASGDVTLDFGDEYFDTGSAQLKPGMISSLKKLFPTYSKSLFEDPKTAEKISNIEIIGFASSTYKGRYVNPSSLKAENQEAISYNLNLSFNRANSIFKYIFDPSKMQYEHQKRLLSMVKVVGRGFLPAGLDAQSIPDDMPEAQFCKKYKCQKAQRVIVKFNLKD